MIEFTTGYTSAVVTKFLINKNHIIYVSQCNIENASYCGVNSYVEYQGGNGTQTAYVKETYEQIKELLK